MNDNEDGLTSGHLARRAGVSVDTLRHYEAKGVLEPPPRRGTYRVYPREALDRVLTVRRALSMGFTLDELRRLFSMRAAGRPPCTNAIALAESKLEQLQGRIDELVALHAEVGRIVDAWRKQLAAVQEGEPAGLFDSLAQPSFATLDHAARRRA